MTLIHENPSTLITLKNNQIQKKYKSGKVPPKFSDPTWLKAYSDLYDFSNIVPKIYGIEGDTILMEYIEGTPLNLLLRTWSKNYDNNFKEIAHWTSKALELLQIQFNYCEVADHPILHTDLWAGNIIIREDDSLCIVDPDEFELYPWKSTLLGHLAILFKLNYHLDKNSDKKRQ